MNYIFLLVGVLLMTSIICTKEWAMKSKPRVQVREIVIPDTPEAVKKEKDPVLTEFHLPGSFFFLQN